MIAWTLHSNVADMLSLGPRTSAKLLRLGVRTVEHLLLAKPHLLNIRLNDERIGSKTIACWQREAALALALPQLGAKAARILVAIEFSSPQKIAHCSPTELVTALEQLEPEQKQAAGFAPDAPPDFVEVSRWIACAQRNLKVRAA